MKRYLFLIGIIAFFATGCISSKNDPKPGDGTASAGNYFPVSSGSTWTYNEELAGKTGTTVQKMTGKTKTINGKNYFEATSASTVKGNNTAYFYNANHVFTILQTIPQENITIEVTLGDDSKAAGYTWTTKPTTDGLVRGYPAQMINTINETGISRTVNGKTFTDVIHTQSDLQYDLGFGFTSYSLYDFYLAKGVGMIESDTSVQGTVYDKETITSYTVK
jgi:hypothetical protein